MKLEGPVCLLFEMELSSFSFDLSKLSVSSCRGLGRGLFFLEAGGALSSFARSEVSSLLFQV